MCLRSWRIKLIRIRIRHEFPLWHKDNICSVHHMVCPKTQPNPVLFHFISMRCVLLMMEHRGAPVPQQQQKMLSQQKVVCCERRWRTGTSCVVGGIPAMRAPWASRPSHLDWLNAVFVRTVPDSLCCRCRRCLREHISDFTHWADALKAKQRLTQRKSDTTHQLSETVTFQLYERLFCRRSTTLRCFSARLTKSLHWNTLKTLCGRWICKNVLQMQTPRV